MTIYSLDVLPFPTWNQSVVPHPFPPVASWPAYRFLKRQVNSVQSLGCVRLFSTPWTTAHQASLSITNCRSLPKPMSIESVMPSNHLILCHPLLLLPSIFPNIRVFSNESALRIRWPKYWSFSFNIGPSSEYPGLIFRRQVRWSGIPMSQNFSQFIVILIVNDFGIVNKAEIDVFLEFSCFSDDPVDVGNLIWFLCLF